MRNCRPRPWARSDYFLGGYHTRHVTSPGTSTPAPDPQTVPRASRVAGVDIAGLRKRMGMGPRAFLAAVLLPIACLVIVVATLVLAPADERPLLLAATVVAMAAGLSSTAIGVYGGVLVPGLLLLG